MSTINITGVNPNAIPAPANGEIEIFADTGLNLGYKDPLGTLRYFGAIFGKNFTDKKKTADQTTTSTTFQNYDTLSLNAVESGNYLIFMRWVWGYSSGSNDINVRWQLDNVDMVEEHRQEPKDGGSDQRYHNSSFTVIQLDGNHVINVDFRSTSSGNQARMYETEFLLFRID